MHRLSFKRGDVIAVIAVLLLAVGSAVFAWQGLRSPAVSAIVTTPSGSTVYALERPQVLTVTGENGMVLTVELDVGRIRVKDSTCPDLLCVHSGWLSRGGQAAACVPAGVSITVLGGDNAVDGVTA